MASSGGSGGGSKTGTVLGFLFDFRSNAGTALKKVRDELAKTTKSWGLDFGKLRKKVSLAFLQMSGDVKLFLRRLQRTTPEITDVIRQIGDSFGGVAGIIADTVLRPGALLSALGATAVKVGMDMNKTQVTMRRETALTTEEIQKYRDAMVEVSRSMESPLSQVEGLALAFSAANVSQEDFIQLSKTALLVNKLTGLETGHVAEQIKLMNQRYKMSPAAIHAFYNAAQGVAVATKSNISEIISKTEAMSEIVGQFLPDMYAEGMTGAVKIAGVLGDSFTQVEPMLGKFFSSLRNMSSDEFKQFRVLVGRAGADVAQQFENAIANKDFAKAFEQIHKGMRSFSREEFETFARLMPNLEETFGVSLNTLHAFREMPMALHGTIDAQVKIAQGMDSIKTSTKDIRSLTEKWHVLWGQIERIALPFGERLVELLNKLSDVAISILKPIENFVAGLSEGEQKGLLILGAMLSFKILMGPIIGLLKIIRFQFVSIASKSYDIIAGVTGISRALRGASRDAAVLDEVTGIVTVTANGATGAFKRMGLSILGNLKMLGRVLWPLALMTAAVSLLDGLFKSMFNVSAMEAFSIVFEFVGKILEGIGSTLAWIIKMVWKIVTLGGLFGDIDKPAIDAKKLVPKNGVISQMESDLATSGSETVSADGTIQTPNSPLRPEITAMHLSEDAKKETDRLIEAQYGSMNELGKVMVAALSQLAQRPIVTGAPAGPSRHQSIEAAGNSGPR